MKILLTGTAGFTPWNKIEDFNAEHHSTGFTLWNKIEDFNAGRIIPLGK